MGMVIDPELPVRHVSDRLLARAQILTVLRYEKVSAIENVVIDPINNPLSAVVRERS